MHCCNYIRSLLHDLSKKINKEKRYNQLITLKLHVHITTFVTESTNNSKENLSYINCNHINHIIETCHNKKKEGPMVYLIK